MKFLIFSDTHGETQKPAEICEKHADIDAIIHLGDYQEDGDTISEETGIKVYAVAGNCDAYRSPFGGPSGKQREYIILETEAGKIFLTHGHRQNVKSSLQSLLYTAEEKDCCAAFFGHTHVPLHDESSDVLLFNPGSISHPALGLPPSYGVVTVTEDGIDAEICYYFPTADTPSDTISEADATSRATCKVLPEGGNKKPSATGAESPRSKVKGGYLKNILNNSDRL